MPRLVVVNDLSFQPRLPDVQAAAAIGRFVDLVISVRKRFKRVAMLSHLKLSDLTVGSTYSVTRWLGADSANLDRWRAVKALVNRAPYSAALSEAELRRFNDVEAVFEGHVALGLGLAALLDTLALSAPTNPVWDTEQVTILLRSLSQSDTEEGEILIVEENVSVRQAATDAHLASHQAWWEGLAYAPSTIEDLWHARQELYPNLRFLPAVENQLRLIGSSHPWFWQACGRLKELQDSAQEWNPVEDPTPTWRSLVTPESPSRRHLCDFTDLDGERRCFEMHARVAPQPGRIYFRIERGDGTLIIAHIGRKIGV